MQTRCSLGISIVMPMHNAATTVLKTLDSLLRQTVAFDEILIVDDRSSDESVQLVEEFFRQHACNGKVIRHETNKGIAESHNDGIRQSRGGLVVTLHQDVVLIGDTALETLVSPFLSQADVVATYHFVDHPYEVWRNYNFWQKCFFARQMGVRQRGLDTKFDCFRRSALIDVGLFDSRTFRNACEDGDMVKKMERKGRVVGTDAGIVHLHDLNPRFGPASIVYKQAQYSEAQGAITRRYGVSSFRELIRCFFREMMVVSAFIPYLRIPALAAILVYAFLYSKAVFVHETRNPRVWILPFLNVWLLFISLVFTVRGFLSGRQSV